MLIGNQSSAWDHTASICATIINMHRDPKKSQPADPAKMNPYRVSKGGKTPKIRLNTEDSMKLLKRVFIDHRVPDMTALQKGILKD